MNPDKVCQDCGRNLTCVHTGANVYLAHTGLVHAADLFMCFKCLTFHVFGLNVSELKSWRNDGEGEAIFFIPEPDVVVAGDYLLIPYDNGSPFSFVGFGTGDIIPLPSALSYMTEKCGHEREIAAYLTKRGTERRDSGLTIPSK